MSISFQTPAEALAWMNKRHAAAKAEAAPPKDKPEDPVENGDQEPEPDAPAADDEPVTTVENTPVDTPEKPPAA